MNILKRKTAILAALTLVVGGVLVTSSVAQAQNTIYVQSKFNGRCMTASPARTASVSSWSTARCLTVAPHGTG